MQCRKGTRVIAERPDGSSITRTTAHFKQVPFRSNEEAHRWSSPKSLAKHLNESPLSTREGGPPGLEQTDKNMIETVAEESIPAKDALSDRAAAPPAWGQGPS